MKRNGKTVRWSARIPLLFIRKASANRLKRKYDDLKGGFFQWKKRRTLPII